MCRKKTTSEQIEQILALRRELSNSEIAEKLNLSISTVKRILREYGVTRTRKEAQEIRSRTRKNLIKSERRRAIFGLDQRTDIKVFTNRERNILKYCLKRRHYVFLHRGENTAYYNEQTSRNRAYEERGSKLGIKFKQIENQYQ